MNYLKVGLTTGGFFALLHTAWVSLVASGHAQSCINWIFTMHFITNPFVIQPFVLATALKLVAFTFIVGFVYGVIFAALWNFIKQCAV